MNQEILHCSRVLEGSRIGNLALFGVVKSGQLFRVWQEEARRLDSVFPVAPLTDYNVVALWEGSLKARDAVGARRVPTWMRVNAAGFAEFGEIIVCTKMDDWHLRQAETAGNVFSEDQENQFQNGMFKISEALMCINVLIFVSIAVDGVFFLS
ncbi:hypothetical protein NDU88_005289 [Pleurodeles waltl]|uniref:Uncharacterized protein n=1 Tax=Pleurodeles waltl TaxID=8319 RepID=A0AAV7NNK7_PLEWA|nr:hypothetical protein NDU88_005289 [Pleurodeles waltl]